MTVCTLCLYILLLFISCRITFYELIGIGQKIFDGKRMHLTKLYEHYEMRVPDISCLYAMIIVQKVPLFPQIYSQSPIYAPLLPSPPPCAL